MRLQILDPEAKFSCGACSNCCRQPWRTMIDADRAAAIESHDFSAYPQLQNKTVFRPAADGSKGFLDLAKGEGDACIFLDSDNLCIIHKEMGAAAKPHMCRQFPYLPSRTPAADRIALSFGCPSVQKQHGAALDEQTAEINELIPLTPRPARDDALVSLNETLSLSWAEYEALMARLTRCFDDAPRGDIWQRFAECLTIAEWTRTRVEQVGSGNEETVAILSADAPIPGIAAAPEITAFDSAARAPLPVRLLFASTLYGDTLPPNAVKKLSFFQRLTLVPRLMSLAKMSGVYPSRFLRRNIQIDRVLAHEVAPDLAPDAEELLLRYFRSRFWMRLQVGNRLSVGAGLHQHIVDFSAIIFLARAEAERTGALQLNYDLVSRALAGVELHIANQARIYEMTMGKWFRTMLDEPIVALGSLELLSLRKDAPVVTAVESN